MGKVGVVGVVGLEVGAELLRGFEVRGRGSGGTRRRHSLRHGVFGGRDLSR